MGGFGIKTVLVVQVIKTGYLLCKWYHCPQRCLTPITMSAMMAPRMSKPMIDMPRLTFLHQIALVKTASSLPFTWVPSNFDVLLLRSISSVSVVAALIGMNAASIQAGNTLGLDLCEGILWTYPMGKQIPRQTW